MNDNNDSLYLRGPEARELRARGHHLKPTVMVGKEGCGEAVTTALEAVFCAHELVKVKIQEACPEDKTTVATKLATASHSRIVQLIGRTILLYRELPAAECRPDPSGRSTRGRAASGRTAGNKRCRPATRVRAGAGAGPGTGRRSQCQRLGGKKVGKIRSQTRRR